MAKGRVTSTTTGDWKVLSEEDFEKWTFGSCFVVEGSDRNILSGGKMLKGGCKISHASWNKIVLEHPSGQKLTFNRDDDDNLYYTKLFVPFDEQYLLSIADEDESDGDEEDDSNKDDEKKDNNKDDEKKDDSEQKENKSNDQTEPTKPNRKIHIN